MKRPARALACALLLSTLAAAADVLPATLAYQMKPGETQRYKLSAKIDAVIPLFESPTPIPLKATINVTYLATPKTLLADGTADVDFAVADHELLVDVGGPEPLPFPLPPEEVQKVLNIRATLARTGEVVKVAGGGDLPFGVTVPGVDPRRLFALIYPVVFQEKPVNVGDTWSFKSLFAAETPGAKPSFSATVLPPSEKPEESGLVRLRETFDMKIDQKVDVDKKPTTSAEKAHRAQTGTVTGNGTLHFDSARGLFTRSVMEVKAAITDRLVGKPRSEDEPKEIISKVTAKVTVDLQDSR